MTKNEKRLIDAAYKNDQVEAEAALKGGLFSRAADINCRTEQGCTPVMAAVNHFAMVQWLIARGADIHARDADENTLLHRAAFNGSTETLAWLLAQGFDIEARNADGATPFIRSIEGNVRDVVEYLLERGAKIDARDNEGETALHKCMSSGRPLWNIDVLLEHGLDINLQGGRVNTTALGTGCYLSSAQAVEHLLAHGARWDIDFKRGPYAASTALQIAVDMNNYDAIRALLRHGATIDEWIIKHVKEKGKLAIAQIFAEVFLPAPRLLSFTCRKCGKTFTLGRDAIVMTMDEVMGNLAQRGSMVVGTVDTATHPDMVGGCPWENLDARDRKRQNDLVDSIAAGQRSNPWTCQDCQETQPYPTAR